MSLSKMYLLFMTFCYRLGQSDKQEHIVSGRDLSASSMNIDILKTVTQSFLKFNENGPGVGSWGVRLNDRGVLSAGEIG